MRAPEVMTANFYGTELYGVRVGAYVLVALKPIVEAMGLEFGLLNIAACDAICVLREGIAVMAIPSGGGLQESTGLKLDLLPGWLFTISTARVKDEATREKITLFRRECFSVLSEHFLGKRKMRGNGPDAYERWSYKLAVEARMLAGPRAGVQMWVMRGLPVPPALQEVFDQLTLFNKKPDTPDAPNTSASRSELLRIGKPVEDPKAGE